MDIQIPDRLPKLDQGGHLPDEHKMCAMEAVSWLAGESFSAHPMCVQSLIGNLVISINDNSSDEERQGLWPVLLRCMGTRETLGTTKNGREIPPTPAMQRKNDELEQKVNEWYQQKLSEGLRAYTVEFLEQALDYFDEISGRNKLPDLTRDDWNRLFEYAQFEEVY